MRLIAGALSAILFGWLLWMLLSGTDFDFAKGSGHDAFTVRCEPMIWGNSWYDSWDADDADGAVANRYDITGGEQPKPPSGADPTQRGEAVLRIEGQLNQICDNARTGQAGLMAVVAVPAAVLGAFAVLGRRPARPGARDQGAARIT
jgi:hypothetical protein